MDANQINPFNHIKALSFAKRFDGIINDHYYPPVVVNLDVTGKCQYACGHCHHRSKQIKLHQMPDLDPTLARTFPHFMKSWEEDGEHPVACCIVGSKGDALLYPQLPDLLRNLHFAGIDIGLVSNGYGLTPKLADYAVHYCKFYGVSVDAGTAEAYKRVHNCPNDGWLQMNKNTMDAVLRAEEMGSSCDIGWKFLILPQSYDTLYEGCRVAKELGIRWVQIRPADLPEDERRTIDINVVNEQVARAVSDFNEPGIFEVVNIKNKFTPDLKKILPAYCYMTPLTVTITSDALAWACVDRRCDAPTLLADCKKSWQALKDVWGTDKHIRIVKDVINRGGQGPDCNIRCSSYCYDELFRLFFLRDNFDRTLI